MPKSSEEESMFGKILNSCKYSTAVKSASLLQCTADFRRRGHPEGNWLQGIKNLQYSLVSASSNLRAACSFVVVFFPVADLWWGWHSGALQIQAVPVQMWVILVDLSAHLIFTFKWKGLDFIKRLRQINVHVVLLQLTEVLQDCWNGITRPWRLRLWWCATTLPFRIQVRGSHFFSFTQTYSASVRYTYPTNPGVCWVVLKRTMLSWKALFLKTWCDVFCITTDRGASSLSVSWLTKEFSLSVLFPGET